jgi:hypothetical protein
MIAGVAAGVRPEVEIKYLLPRERDRFVLEWLQSVVSPERQWPPARVVTTYCDTPELDLLDEKVNSDYLKTKVRVRWYAPLGGGPATSRAFIELKSRQGATRGKHRVVADLDVAALEAAPLTDPVWTDLVSSVRRSDPSLPTNLAPVLRLSYARYRFVDAFGGRVSVDSTIAVDAVNPGRVHAPARMDTLPWSVFEYKGHQPDLPAFLAPVTRFGARRSAFSKYLACYEHVTRHAF